MYWIDPNLGSPTDAVEVFCDFKHGISCVEPLRKQIDKGHWYTGPAKRVWFGLDIENGFTFHYKMAATQLRHLQMLSSHATQNITAHCRNTVVYHSSANMTHDKAAIFLGHSEVELVASKPSRFRYTVPLDECQYRLNKWTKTIFEFNTHKSRRLPIIDFALSDVGGAEQAFGLDIGPVCFY
jgi:hypothetical protein